MTAKDFKKKKKKKTVIEEGSKIEFILVQNRGSRGSYGRHYWVNIAKYMEATQDLQLMQNSYWQRTTTCRSGTVICSCPLSMTAEDICWDDTNKEWVQLEAQDMALGMARTDAKIWQHIIDMKNVGIKRFNDALRHIIKYPKPENIWGPNESGESNSHVGCSESLSDVNVLCSICQSRMCVFRCSESNCEKHAHLFCAMLHTQVLTNGWVATFQTRFDDVLPVPLVFCPEHSPEVRPDIISKSSLKQITTSLHSSSIQLLSRPDQYSQWRNRILPGGGIALKDLQQGSEWKVRYTGQVSHHNQDRITAKIRRIPFRNKNNELNPDIGQVSPDESEQRRFHKKLSDTPKALRLYKDSSKGYSAVFRATGNLSNVYKIRISVDDSQLSPAVIRRPSDMTVKFTNDDIANKKINRLRQHVYPKVLNYMLGHNTESNYKGLGVLLYGEGSKRIVLTELSVSERMGGHNVLFVDGTSISSTHLAWRKLVESYYPKAAEVSDFERGGNAYETLLNILSDKQGYEDSNTIPVDPSRFRNCTISLHLSLLDDPVLRSWKPSAIGSSVLDASCLAGGLFSPTQQVVLKKEKRRLPPAPSASQLKRIKEAQEVKTERKKSLFSKMPSWMNSTYESPPSRVSFRDLEIASRKTATEQEGNTSHVVEVNMSGDEIGSPPQHFEPFHVLAMQSKQPYESLNSNEECNSIQESEKPSENLSPQSKNDEELIEGPAADVQMSNELSPLSDRLNEVLNAPSIPKPDEVPVVMDVDVDMSGGIVSNLIQHTESYRIVQISDGKPAEDEREILSTDPKEKLLSDSGKDLSDEVHNETSINNSDKVCEEVCLGPDLKLSESRVFNIRNQVTSLEDVPKVSDPVIEKEETHQVVLKGTQPESIINVTNQIPERTCLGSLKSLIPLTGDNHQHQPDTLNVVVGALVEKKEHTTDIQPSKSLTSVEKEESPASGIQQQSPVEKEEQPACGIQQKPLVEKEEQPAADIQQQYQEEQLASVEKEESPASGIQQQSPVEKEEPPAAGIQRPVEKEEPPASGIQQQSPVEKEEPPASGIQQKPPVEKEEQPASGIQQPAEREEPPASGIQQPVEKEEPPASGIRQQSPVEKEEPPAAGIQRPVEKEEPPASGIQQQSPVEKEEPPASGIQQKPPVEKEEQPASGIQQPAEREEPPASGIQQPVEKEEPPASGIRQQSPVEKEEPPAAGIQQKPPVEKEEQPASVEKEEQPACGIQQSVEKEEPPASGIQQKPPVEKEEQPASGIQQQSPVGDSITFSEKQSVDELKRSTSQPFNDSSPLRTTSTPEELLSEDQKEGSEDFITNTMTGVDGPPETPQSQKTSLIAPSTEKHVLLPSTPATEPKRMYIPQLTTIMDRLRQKRGFHEDYLSRPPPRRSKKATEHIKEMEAQLDEGTNKQIALYIHDIEQAPMTFLTLLNNLYRRFPTKVRICASVLDSRKAQLLAVTVLKHLPIQFIESSTSLPDTINRIVRTDPKKSKTGHVSVDSVSSWIAQFKSIASSGSTHANVMLWLVSLLQHRCHPSGVPLSVLINNASSHLSFSRIRDDVQHHLHIYMDHKIVVKIDGGREELFVIPVSQPDTLEKMQRELQDCVGEFYGDELRPQRIPTN